MLKNLIFSVVLVGVSVPIYKTFDWKGLTLEGIVIVVAGGANHLLRKKAKNDLSRNPNGDEGKEN